MLRWTARWVRATFDYNPAFPLSAVLLLAGMLQLARSGPLDLARPGATLGGLGLLQAYELCLLGAALFVLWPRRIAYETNAILIVFGLVRFTGPFLLIGFAIEGHPLEAALLGAGLAAALALKNEVLARRVLPAPASERAYDALLYAVASIAFPLLAFGMARGTGKAFSHETARLLQLGAWWAIAILLAPLAARSRWLAADRELRVPGPTVFFDSWASRRTGLAILGLPFLLGSALWLSGSGPVPFFLLPLGLVAASVLAAVARANGLETPGALAHLPAALAALVLFAPLDWLVGPVHFLSQPHALAAFLPVAAASLRILAPAEARSGLKSIAAVAALAPIGLAPSWHEVELYLLAVAVLGFAVGTARRKDVLVGHAALASLALALHLAWPLELAGCSQLVLGWSAALAVAAAWRLGAGSFAATTAIVLAWAAGIFEAAHGPPSDATLALGTAAVLATALLGRKGALALAALLGGRRVASGVDPGVLLVVLAFASIGAGTAIAVRRERRVAA